MIRTSVRRLAAGLAIVLIATPQARAQIRASERGGVSQRIDGTDITVDYARPSARGRELFGQLVHWGEMWTPGANWATTIEFSRDGMLNGHDVPAGRYSMWMVPDEVEWTVNLSPKADRFHTQRPPEDEFLVSVRVTPEAGEYMERLTFHFPELRRDGATLHMHWGTTFVALDVGVHPTAATTAPFTAEEIAPYLGFYDLKMFGEGGQALDFDVELLDASGKLRGLVNDGEFAFQLVRGDDPNTFYFGFLQDGQVVDIEEGPVHFDYDGDQLTGFTIFGIGIEVWMTAVRRK